MFYITLRCIELLTTTRDTVNQNLSKLKHKWNKVKIILLSYKKNVSLPRTNLEFQHLIHSPT